MNRRALWLSVVPVLIGGLLLWAITRDPSAPALTPGAIPVVATATDGAVPATAAADAPTAARVAGPAADPTHHADGASGATLRGIVRFQDGRPAAGALIRLHDREPPLAAQKVERGVMARGRRGARDGELQSTHDLGDRAELPLQMPRSEEDPAEAPPREPLAVVAADATGRFELRAARPGRHHLDAIAPLAWCVAPLELDLAGDETREDLALVLGDGAALRGRVVAPDGTPVAGARVVAATRFDPFMMFAAGGMEMRPPWEALADARGEFALAGVPPDLELDVFARSPGFAPSPRLKVRTRVGESAEAVCRLIAGGTIEVAAIDPVGAPAADVVVELRAGEVKLDEITAGDEGLSGSYRKLDAAGRVRFDGLAPGRYELTIDREPWQPATATVTLTTPGETANATLELTDGLELHGRVLAMDGVPLEGARVVAAEPMSLLNVMKSARGAGRRGATCAADGAFVLRGLPKGSIELTARAKGYEQRKVTAEPGGAPVEIVLPTCGAIEGIVISQLTAKPIPEFTLELERRGDGGGGLFDFEATLRSQTVSLRCGHPQGRFRVAGIAPGELRIAIAAAGHGRHVGDWFRLEDGATRKGIIATLGPEAVIEGVVVSAEGQAAVAGAAVSLAGESRDPMRVMLANLLDESLTTTADDGSFRVGGLAAGRHRLVIRKDGFVTHEAAAIPLGAGERVGPLRFELSVGGEIHGTVLASDGNPQAGASLMCQDMTRMSMLSTRSDASGRYRFAGLAPGTYALTRMPAEMSLGGDTMFEELQGQIETHTVKLAAGQSLQVDFGLAAKGRAILSGEVLSAGQPVAQAMVQVFGSEAAAGGGGGGVAIASSDASGRFRLEQLSAGRAFVQVNLGDLAGGGMNAALVPVELRDGEVTEVTLRVPAAAVTGTIVDAASGAPLPGIAIYVGAAADAATGGLEQAMRRSLAIRSDAHGRFTLTPVRPGAARLVAGGGDLLGGVTRDHAVTSLPITVPEAGTLDVGAVRLPRAATIAGTLVDATGAPVAQGSVFLRDSETLRYLEEWSATSSDANGEFEYVGVPEGRWDVVARAPGHATAVAPGVRTRTGEVARTRIELKGGTEVFAELGEVPFSELLDASVAVDGPEGPIPLTLFGLSELTDALRAPFEPGRLRLGRFGAGSYRVRGRIGARSIDAELILAGEPVLHVKIDLP